MAKELWKTFKRKFMEFTREGAKSFFSTLNGGALDGLFKQYKITFKPHACLKDSYNKNDYLTLS